MSDEQETDDAHDDSARPRPPVQLDYRTCAPHHKPIAFVAAASPDREARSLSSKDAISTDYLSLVLSSSTSASATNLSTHEASVETCKVCSLPVSQTQIKQHHTSTAHQVCLEHTHVPLCIDRRRKGAQYLAAYGWDPDARRGLGHEERPGLLHPLKPKEKADKSGVGTLLVDDNVVKRKKVEKETKKMGVKEIRKAHKTDRKRAEKLQRMFYSSGDVERYLGEDA